MNLKSSCEWKKIGLLCLLQQAVLFGQMTQLSGNQTRIAINMQSGTTYTILASDCGKLLSFSNPNPVAVTIPPAGSNGLAAGCWMDIENVGPGAVALTPGASLIDQAASLQLNANQGLRLVSSGTGYVTERGAGSAGGSGTVTNTTGGLVASALVTGNGGVDIKTPVAAATMDNNGNLTIPGALTANTACQGCAGAVDLGAGTDPGAGQPANSFSLIAPAAIVSAYRWKVPAADAAGAIVSDGAGTPGTLSILPFSGSGNLVKTTSPSITTPLLIAPVIQSYTVALLPSASNAGTAAYVTDGATSSDCATGGGSNKVFCMYTGSSWGFPGGASAGGGGGSTVSVGPYASMPACATAGFDYRTSDWILSYVCSGSNLYAFFGGQEVNPPGLLSNYTLVTGYSNPRQEADGIVFTTVLGETSLIGIQSNTTFGPASIVESAFQLESVSGAGCGPALIVNDTTYYIAQMGFSGYGPAINVNRIVNGSGTNLWGSNIAVAASSARMRLRGTGATTVVAEISLDNGNNWKDIWGGGAQDYSTLKSIGTVKAGFGCAGQNGSSILYHLKVTP